MGGAPLPDPGSDEGISSLWPPHCHTPTTLCISAPDPLTEGPMTRTFSLWCAIEAQQTFDSDQLEADPEGAAGSLVPRDDVMVSLQEQIRAAVSPYLHVVRVEIEVDQDLDERG